MKRLKVGGWVTETGLGTVDLQDFHQLSWMHWDYKVNFIIVIIIIIVIIAIIFLLL
jgi:Tfp pilus assembly protein PilO